MPLDRDTRYHLEVAIVVYLKGREATSEGILKELEKSNYRIAPDLRQVVAICNSLRRRGTLFSRSEKRTTFWSFNKKFYDEHPGESCFIEHTPMSLKDYFESLKRRTKKSPKKRK